MFRRTLCFHDTNNARHGGARWARHEGAQRMLSPSGENKEAPEHYTKPRPHIWAPSGPKRCQVQILEGSLSFGASDTIRRGDTCSHHLAGRRLRSEPHTVAVGHNLFMLEADARPSRHSHIFRPCTRSTRSGLSTMHWPCVAVRHPSPSSVCPHARKRRASGVETDQQVKAIFSGGARKVCCKGRHFIPLPATADESPHKNKSPALVLLRNASKMSVL